MKLLKRILNHDFDALDLFGYILETLAFMLFFVFIVALIVATYGALLIPIMVGTIFYLYKKGIFNEKN